MDRLRFCQLILSVGLVFCLACKDSGPAVADSRAKPGAKKQWQAAKNRPAQPPLSREQLIAKSRNLDRKIDAAMEKLAGQDPAAAKLLAEKKAALLERKRLLDDAVMKRDPKGKEMLEKLDKLGQASTQLVKAIELAPPDKKSLLQKQRRAIGEESKPLWQQRKVIIDQALAADAGLRTAVAAQAVKAGQANKELVTKLRNSKLPESDLIKQRYQVRKKLKEMEVK